MKDGRSTPGDPAVESVWRAEGCNPERRSSRPPARPFPGRWPIRTAAGLRLSNAPPPAATIASGQVAKLADIVPATPGGVCSLCTAHHEKQLREYSWSGLLVSPSDFGTVGLTTGGVVVESPTARRAPAYLFAIRLRAAWTVSVHRRRVGSARRRGDGWPCRVRRRRLCAQKSGDG